MEERTVILGQLAEDFAARVRNGEMPAINEYAEKYPKLADRIRDLFPTLMVLEGMASQDQTIAGKNQPGMTSLNLKKGDVFGSFRIEKELGRGGMGVVYHATHQALDKEVALKVLPQASSPVSKNLERFLREARTAAKLHHTNIVPVFDVGQADGIAYYAMQLVEGSGVDLLLSQWFGQASQHQSDAETIAPSIVRKTLASNEMSEHTIVGLPETHSDWDSCFRQIASIGIQVADGLQHAHSCDVIHRDIKPSNLIVDGNDNVWITDFGLSRHVDDPSLTHTGMLLGTPRYMSPEQAAAAAKPIDHRTDIYSLGATLYELVAQRPPFNASTPVEFVMAVLERSPPPLRRLNPHLSKDLETVIQKSMAKDPDNRYQSAAAMADDLRRWSAGESISARRASPIERLGRWAKRNPAWAALWACAILTVVSTIVFSINANRLRYIANSATEQATKQQAMTVQLLRRNSAMLAGSLLEKARFERLGRKPGHQKRSHTAIAGAGNAILLHNRQPIGDSKDGTDVQKNDPVDIPTFADLRTEFLLSLQTPDYFEVQRIQGIPVAASGDGEVWGRVNSGDLETGTKGDHALEIFETSTGKVIYKRPMANISCFALDKTGSRMAQPDANGNIVVLAIPNDRKIIQLDLPGGQNESGNEHRQTRVRTIQFLGEDRFVVAQMDSSTLAVWDLDTDRSFQVNLNADNFGFYKIHFSDVSNQLVLTERKVVRFISVKDGTTADEIPVMKNCLWPFCFNKDESLLYVASSNEKMDGKANELTVIDTKSRQTIASLPLGMDVPSCVTISPDGQKLVVGMMDGRVVIFGVNDHQEIASFRAARSPVIEISFADNGSTILANCIATISAWEMKRDSPVTNHELFDKLIAGPMAIHPIGGELLRGGSSIRHLVLPECSLLNEVELGDAHIEKIVCSQHHTLAAFLTGRGHPAKIYDLEKKQLTASLPEAIGVGFAADGKACFAKLSNASAKPSEARVIEILEAASQKNLCQISVPVNTKLSFVTFMPNGNHVVVSYQELTTEYQPLDPAQLENVFIPSASTIKIVDVQTGNTVSQWNCGCPIQDVKFSRDGRVMAGVPGYDRLGIVSSAFMNTSSVSGSRLPIVDLQKKVQSVIQLDNILTGVAIRPDGKELALRASDGTIEIFDMDKILASVPMSPLEKIESDQVNGNAVPLTSIKVRWQPNLDASFQTESSILNSFGASLQVKYSPDGSLLYANNMIRENVFELNARRLSELWNDRFPALK